MANPPHKLQQVLGEMLSRHPGVRRWIIAYSGGLDSSALLHAAATTAASQSLLAIHVHHGMSPFADQWQQHCRARCAELGIEYLGTRVEVDAGAGNVEEAAREARYASFQEILCPGDGLLMAHHQDDQAETVLLRLMRGSGARGLSAIPYSRPLGDGLIVRPWLGVTRDAIHAYAQHFDIEWIEDHSNRAQNFDRNYLRHRVMPVLRERWPQFTRSWRLSAELLSSYEELAMQIAEQDLARADPRCERVGHSIAVASLLELSSFRCGNLLRSWLQSLRWPMPDRAGLTQVREQLLLAEFTASSAAVSCGDGCLRRFRERLYLCPRLIEPRLQVHWPGGAPLQWGDWNLSLERDDEHGFELPDGGLLVTPREPGERCHPSWREHSQSLKKLLQEVELEPWLRRQIPMLRDPVSGELLAVADLWSCRGSLAAAKDKPGYRLQWRWQPQT